MKTFRIVYDIKAKTIKQAIDLVKKNHPNAVNLIEDDGTVITKIGY